MDVDMWASLTPDLLLEIVRRLESTAILRSTRVCKPWRVAIIGNAASCLCPRPDCFVPSLLVGFLHNYRDKGRRHVRLQLLPEPPLESAAHAVTTAADATRFSTLLSSFAQSSSAGGADLSSYDELLSSRDGILLLGGRAVQDLCLRSAVTGDLKILPAAAFKACSYVLVTAYDLTLSDAGGSGGHDLSSALILAVKEKGIKGGMTYQIFSTSDGAWGEVVQSPRFVEGLAARIYTGSEVICRGGEVHWLGLSADLGVVKCTVAVDVRTRRTWLTELPECCGQLNCYGSLCTSPVRLATSRDGRLSVVSSSGPSDIQVWVLDGADQWTLTRRISVQNVLPLRTCSGYYVWFDTFFPRSGCLLGHIHGQVLLIDVDKGSYRLIGHIDSNHGARIYPYEMDWSTYMTKMKHF